MNQTFRRLDVPPAYKVVYEAIEKEIVSGRLKEGDQLPTETELAEQFGVNRSTVREGIRLLEQSGLVRREAGRRLHVSLPHYAELAPRFSRAMIMQRVTFRELWEVSMALEPMAAEGAAQRIDDAQIARIEENIAGTRRALARNESIIQWDLEFHLLIAEAAANKALLLSREPTSILFYPTLRRLFTHASNKGVAERRLLQAHEYILDALKARDADTAREWMRKHIIDFKRGYDLCGIDLDAAVERMPARVVRLKT